MTGSLAWLHRMVHKRPVQARNALSISVKSCMLSSTAPEPAVNGGSCRAIFRLGITSGTPTERGAMTAHGSTLTRSFTAMYGPKLGERENQASAVWIARVSGAFWASTAMGGEKGFNPAKHVKGR